jgi:hypothetical protein
MRFIIPGFLLLLGGVAALNFFAGRRARDVAVEPAVVLTRSALGNPTVAYDGRRGAALVAWIGGRHGRPDVYLATELPDGTGEAVRVNDVPGDAAPHEQAPAQVAVGPDGSVYVAWQSTREVPGRRYPASDLRFARSTDGGKTFSRAITVNDDAGGRPSSHTFHDVAVAPDGTIYVSWLDSRVRDSAAASRPPSTPSAAAPSAADAQGRTMEHDGHGAMEAHGMEGHAISGHAGHGMDDPTLPASEIRIARSTDGGKSFEASRVVDAGVCPCCRTSLAVGPDGSVYVAWRKVFPGNVRDVVVARRRPRDTAFSAPVRVHADGWVYPGCPHAGPSLAVDGRGRLHVAWYTGREGRQGLWHAVSADGGRTFGQPDAVLTGGWVPPAQVRLTSAGDGVWMAWDDRREKTPKLSLGLAAGAEEVKRVADGESGKAPALGSGSGPMNQPVAVAAWLDGTSIRVRRMSRPGSADPAARRANTPRPEGSATR